MPALVYTVSPFVPFTKILSADVNQYFTDIKSRVNWAGGTSATTGLNDDNIQSIAASGGGLTRATKLKVGTANYVLINSGTGAMSEEATLDLSRGGIGFAVVPGNYQAGDVLQINPGLTAFTIGAPTAVPAPSRLFNFLRFS